MVQFTMLFFTHTLSIGIDCFDSVFHNDEFDFVNCIAAVGFKSWQIIKRFNRA